PSAWRQCDEREGDNRRVAVRADPSHPELQHSVNPATGERLGSVPLTDPAEIEDVVASARRVQPLWALLRPADRARYMRRVAQAVIDEFGDLVELLAREQGRPPSEVATLELL